MFEWLGEIPMVGQLLGGTAQSGMPMNINPGSNALDSLYKPYNRGDVLGQQLGAGLQAFGTALLRPGAKGTAMPNAIASFGEGFSQSKDSAINNALKKQRRKDLYDWVNGLPEEEQQLAAADPESYAQMYMDQQKAQFKSQLPGVNEGEWYAPKQIVDEKGNYFWAEYNKSGERRLTPFQEGTHPSGQLKMVDSVSGTQGIDPFTGQPRVTVEGSDPASMKAAEAGGTATGKATAERNQDAIGFMSTLDQKITRMDEVMAGADKFSGISPKAWGNAIKDYPEYRYWNNQLEALKADATAMAMGTTKSLYPMSEADRAFLQTMATGGIDNWLAPKDLQRAMNIMRNANIARAERIQSGTESVIPTVDITKYKKGSATERSDEDIDNEYGVGD